MALSGIYVDFLAFVFSFFSAINPLIGQDEKISISGQVVDTAGNVLPGATVVLLQRRDSVIESFTLSDAKGQFRLHNIERKDYWLRITFLGLQPYAVSIDRKVTSPFQAGIIEMLPEENVIEGVEVEDELIPIAIKKDTIEYNARAFKTPENAVVEDLLKRLPGVEVDRDGNIKAGGEDVDQVLVEGKPFFGSDPKIATKNLPADAVDKVQVFDKKSEMATFSGIDDGEEDRAINLKLKEDKKQGYFGNVSGGYGTKGRYEGKLSLNRFDKKSQFSVLGMLNNTNQQAFSTNDYINFMGGLQSLMSGGGGTFRMSLNSGTGGIPMDQMSTFGIRTAASGGLNFNREFGKKTELGVSYFFNRLTNDLEQNTFEQQFLGDGNSFTTRESNDQLSTNNNHRLTLNLRHELDSFSRLSFRSSLVYNQGWVASRNQRTVDNSDGILENAGSRTFDANGSGLQGDATFTYMRRFKKRGRALVGRLSGALDQTAQEADLSAINNFADDLGGVVRMDTLLQDQAEEDYEQRLGGKLSYTEPLGRGKYLELNIARQQYANDYRRDVFDLLPENTSQTQLNTELSNQYDRLFRYDRAGLNVKLSRSAFNMNAGLDYQRSALEGVIGEEAVEIDQKFYNWLPRLRWSYDFATARSIRFDYRTAVREPSLEQLNPVVDNSNPLNIYVGNPGLRPAYNHVIGLRFNSFSQFSFTSIFANVTATITENPIRNAQFIDSLFIQTIQPLNVDNNYNIDAFASFSTPIRKLKSRININAGVNYNNGINFINLVENRTKQVVTTLDVSLENRKKEVFDWLIGFDWEYNNTAYSIQKEQNQTFSTRTIYGDWGVNIGKRWRMNSSVDYSIYQGAAFEEDQQLVICRASVSHYFLKNNRAEIRVSAVDLLNQNQGVRRVADLNFISETRTRALGRYFMLTLRYKLSGFGNTGGGIQIFQGRRGN